MSDDRASAIPDQVLSDMSMLRIKPADFARLSELVRQRCGIRMPPNKSSTLETRLSRRVRELGLKGFAQYCQMLFSGTGGEQELVRMIDLVTTNKTDFYREPSHFAYLTQFALPELAKRTGAGPDRSLRIWSAGCSSGEEPYTLAMVLSEYGRNVPGFRFRVLGTDISTRVLHAAA